jgi:hypothetical protein
VSLQISQKHKKATLEMTVIRADGTRENLGVVGYSHRSKIKNFFGNLRISIKRRLRK